MANINNPHGHGHGHGHKWNNKKIVILPIFYFKYSLLKKFLLFKF